MGLSAKKQTSNQVQDTTSHAVTTPNVPDWLLQPAQTIAGNLGDILKQGPGAFTPQTSGLQKQAFTGAGALSTSPLYDEAAGVARGVQPVQGQSLLDGLDHYYNPYKDQVLNPVLNDYDVNSGKTRAAQAAQAAGTGAFRGSRYGIREASTEGELARGRAATEGGLLHDMFDTATSLSGEDANRRQSAMTGNADRTLQEAGLLSNVAGAQGADTRANLGVQDLLGQQQTDQDNARTQYPITFNGQAEGLFGGLDPSLFTGQDIDSTGHMTGTDTSTTSGNPLGSIAQIAAMLAMGGKGR